MSMVTLSIDSNSTDDAREIINIYNRALRNSINNIKNYQSLKQQSTFYPCPECLVGHTLTVTNNREPVTLSIDSIITEDSREIICITEP